MHFSAKWKREKKYSFIQFFCTKKNRKKRNKKFKKIDCIIFLKLLKNCNNSKRFEFWFQCKKLSLGFQSSIKIMFVNIKKDKNLEIICFVFNSYHMWHNKQVFALAAYSLQHIYISEQIHMRKYWLKQNYLKLKIIFKSIFCL